MLLRVCVVIAFVASPSTVRAGDSDQLEGWDFVVVGAGTGGSLCAARLAATGSQVLLLEAGKWDPPELYEPGRARNVLGNIWAYPTRLPHPLTVQNDKEMRQRITAGKIMGGTSAVHGDVYDRPPYKEFEYFGIRSWDEAAVRNAFSQIEKDITLTWIGEHNLDAIPDAQFWVIDKLLTNMPLIHHPRAAPNGAKGGLAAGWWYYRSCPLDDRASLDRQGCRRHTSYRDLIANKNQSKAPESVTVWDEAHVSRVLMESGEAIGVEVQRQRGGRQAVFVRRAVILAAGALGTPKLLMLSGIGDPLELQRLGVPIQVANREVGQGLADHLATYTWFLIRGGPELKLEGDACTKGEKFNIFYNLTGPASDGDGLIDAEVRFLTECNMSRKTFDFGVEAVLLHPESRGRVFVPSARPEDLPLAEFPTLWARDYERLEAVLRRLADALGARPEDLIADKGMSLSESVRTNGYLYQHLCCSARVAPAGEVGVCDEQLRVRGVSRLFVADASALPMLPSAHTSAPALLVGELAAASALRHAALRPLPVWTSSTDQVAADTVLEVPTLKLASFDAGEPVLLPQVGLGTGTQRKHAVADAVATFLRLGGRHLDTAAMYDNYAEVRAGIEASGHTNVSELVVTGKFMPLGHAAVRSEVDKAIIGLGVPYLSVALLHWPGDTAAGKLLRGSPLPACAVADDTASWRRCRQESYAALEIERDTGRVRAVGVSNFALRHLDELAKLGSSVPAVHQLELHPSWRDDALLERAARDGTKVQAYGCLGGAHTGAVMLRQEGFRKIAARHNASSAQVLLRWAAQLGTSVVMGGSSATHIEENLHIFDFKLTEDEMSFMSSMPPEAMNKMYGPLPEEIP